MMIVLIARNPHKGMLLSVKKFATAIENPDWVTKEAKIVAPTMISKMEVTLIIPSFKIGRKSLQERVRWKTVVAKTAKKQPTAAASVAVAIPV
jgi:hypothetical protein